MTDTDILRKMQPLHLMLADELKRICEKHDIPFFMIAGTMLGAVREGGFILWDDDMDFGMLRKDFEKFLDVCEGELNPDVFYLHTEQKEECYPFNFVKLSLTGTEFKEEFIGNGNFWEGIYIDIFPVDIIADAPLKNRLQCREFHFANRLLRHKTGFVSKDQPKTFRYLTGQFISRFFTISFLKKIRYRCITRYVDTDSTLVTVSDGSYGIKKETLQRKWVEHLRDYSFEDRTYPGISDCDAYLTHLYGDYMSPPEESEKMHHRRLWVDFGKYDNESE